MCISVIKHANPQADTSKWEDEIDQLVYQLYGLTQEEINMVEGVM
jgi:adenine-specific DNA-methyltransferase